MAINHTFIPPYVRLAALIAAGLAGFMVMILIAFQPPTGWTWDVAQWRNITEFSGPVWSALLTGLLAYLISAWIWALKPTHIPAALFAASGLMTLGFCFTTVIFDLAYPFSDAIYGVTAQLNMLTASGFGILMPCLFFIYPNRLPGALYAIAIVVIGFGGWTLASVFGPPSNYPIVHLITFMEMLVIIAAVIWQIWATRKDPRQNAIAVWLGVSTVVGSGAFIALVAVPNSFLMGAVIKESYAFSFFLLIYIGLAVGLMRYRLFELGAWAYRLAFYVSAAVIMILLDLALIAFLPIGQSQALSVSLLIVALAYLPMRDLVWRRFMPSRSREESDLFAGILDAALQPSSVQRAEDWSTLLREHFLPLEIEETSDNGPTARLDAEGLSLYVPPVRDAHALILRYPNNGQTLFSPRDVSTTQHLVRMMQQAGENRDAYDRGVSEERTRIARDIHDNIGAQLMRALHSARPDRKDTMIRETLADLRDVINNAQSQTLPLDDVLADLRAETADRLEPHEIDLRWILEADMEDSLPPAMVHALRSFIREAASNAIKHSDASELSVQIQVIPANITLQIRDNGKGFTVDSVTLGHGLGNMKARIEGLGGTFSLDTNASGVQLTATLPREA